MGEVKGPNGYIAGIPQSAQGDFEAVSAKVKALQGGLFLYEKMQPTYQETGTPKPIGSDLSRIGFDPPQSLAGLWTAATMQTIEACGIPGGLILGKVEGTAAREALRRARVVTLEPVMRLIARELGKTRNPHSFKFSGDLANDLTSRARAFAAMVKAGMGLPEAAAASGILQEVD